MWWTTTENFKRPPHLCTPSSLTSSPSSRPVFYFLSCLIFLGSLLSSSVAQMPSDRLAQVAKNVFDFISTDRHYDVLVRPPGNETDPNGPVTVRTNIYVRSLSNFDIERWTYDVQITFRQLWNDARLTYNDVNGYIKYIPLSDRSLIWTPDVFFPNELEAKFHDVPVANTLIRIYPNGDVLYSIRLSLRLFCQMDVAHFPFDKQICPITLASYGASTDDIEFVWKYYDPVQVSSALSMPDFSLTSWTTRTCASKTITGEYSCLSADLTLRRRATYWVDQVYWPTALIIFFSLVGFVFPPDALLTRVAIGGTCLLGILVYNSIQRGTMPKVAYARSVDLWMTGCELVAAAVLLSYIAVGLAARRSPEAAKSLVWERAFRTCLPAIILVLMAGYTVAHYGINDD